jgi:hypothetical protein
MEMLQAGVKEQLCVLYFITRHFAKEQKIADEQRQQTRTNQLINLSS